MMKMMMRIMKSKKDLDPDIIVAVETVKSIYEGGIRKLYNKYDDMDKRVQYLEMAINIIVEKIAHDE